MGQVKCYRDVATTIEKTGKWVGVLPVLRTHWIILERQKLSNAAPSHVGQKGNDKFHFLLAP
jgi:hypothetical protein